MAKWVHPSTVVENKHKTFSVFAWHGFC